MIRIKVYGMTNVSDPSDKKRLQMEIFAFKKKLVPFLDEIFIQDPTPRILIKKDRTFKFSAKITRGLKRRILGK
jgi:uncharacterized protein YebE (UPF0316 family)